MRSGKREIQTRFILVRSFPVPTSSPQATHLRFFTIFVKIHFTTSEHLRNPFKLLSVASYGGEIVLDSFSLKWCLQSPFLLLLSTAIDLQEVKDSIDEKDLRPTSSTWNYINNDMGTRDSKWFHSLTRTYEYILCRIVRHMPLYPCDFVFHNL